MCGRYSFAPKPKQLAEILPGVLLPTPLEISFNIAPTQQAYVCNNEHPDSLERMEWGLVPYWSKDGKNSGKLVNARAEGILEKPSFRDSVQSRRCLVPADSFYEWRTEPGDKKAPYRIFLENGRLMLMAGIWDEWRQAGALKRTFSIITTPPNLEMSSLHDRMPLILHSADMQEQWLSKLPADEALDLLRTPVDGLLTMYRVSERINKPGYDHVDLQEQVPEPWRLF